jgi:hypothetical protein
MGTNPLDTVKKAYEVSTECFEIAQAVVQQPRANLFTHSSWPTQANAQQDIDQARQEANDLFVLALWAAFERFVITYLQNKGAILQHLVPNGLAMSVYEHFKEEVEYWKPDEILELLKGIPALDKNLIGQARTILRYRNWVAHGKDVHKKPPVKAMAPAYTHQILEDIINILLLN